MTSTLVVFDKAAAEKARQADLLAYALGGHKPRKRQGLPRTHKAGDRDRSTARGRTPEIENTAAYNLTKTKYHLLIAFLELVDTRTSRETDLFNTNDVRLYAYSIFKTVNERNQYAAFFLWAKKNRLFIEVADEKNRDKNGNGGKQSGIFKVDRYSLTLMLNDPAAYAPKTWRPIARRVQERHRVAPVTKPVIAAPEATLF